MTSASRIRIVAESFVMKRSHASARTHGKGFNGHLPEDAEHR
jgi:hypothetical protein